jgi:hypothetical protein
MPSSVSEPPPTFRLPPIGWLVIVLLLLSPWGAMFWQSRSAVLPTDKPEPVAQTAIASTAPSPFGGVKIGRPGPWGLLEYSRIIIEPPENFISQFSTMPRPLRWTFHGFGDDAFDSLWRKAGLTDVQRQALNAPANRERPGGDIVVIRPSEDLVLGLSETARGVIYAALAVFPENGPQNDVYRIHISGTDDWFDPDLMSPATIALVRPLLYRRGNHLVFSDQDIVLGRLGAPDERLKLIKNLSRRAALLVQLRVEHGADTDALARYWGNNRRNQDVEPLLYSLAHRPEGGTIDLIHLLPPFARALLYTYPVPSDKPEAAARDCHWTSLNFFNATPDDRFLNLDAVGDTLRRNYQPIAGEPTMGDILMLFNADGAGVHSCVYLADGVVFTKNGPGYSVPWLLSRLDDTVAFYSVNGPLRTQIYRAKRS